MKTSYYLVAAAGLTAAAVTAYDRLPLRAEAPAPTLPLRADAAALAAVPDVSLPPIVTPPDGPMALPVADAPHGVGQRLGLLHPLAPQPAGVGRRPVGVGQR